MASSRPHSKLARERLWEYALRLLSRRGYSTGELRTKLSTRAETAAVLNEVMAKLKEYEMVDDKKFAELYAVTRRENESFGKARILRELKARKVPHGVADKAVSRVFSDVNEEELAAQHLERKYRGCDLNEFLQEESRLASAFRRLRRAGFSTSSSIAVLKRFSSRAHELESLPEEPAEAEAGAADAEQPAFD
jgi:regulatory protein